MKITFNDNGINEGPFITGNRILIPKGSQLKRSRPGMNIQKHIYSSKRNNWVTVYFSKRRVIWPASTSIETIKTCHSDCDISALIELNQRILSTETSRMRDGELYRQIYNLRENSDIVVSPSCVAWIGSGGFWYYTEVTQNLIEINKNVIIMNALNGEYAENKLDLPVVSY